METRKICQDIYLIPQGGIEEVIFEKALEAYNVFELDEIVFEQDIVQLLKDSHIKFYSVLIIIRRMVYL